MAKCVFLSIMRLHQQHHRYEFKAERVEKRRQNLFLPFLSDVLPSLLKLNNLQIDFDISKVKTHAKP